MQFQGPYYGLNTTADPTQLPPQWATVARNIVLPDGKIRMRPPWRPVVGDGVPVNLSTADADVCVGLFPWVNTDFERPITMAIVMDRFFTPPDASAAVRLFRIETGVDPVEVGELVGTTRTTAPSWLLWQGWLYISVGQDNLWKTDGQTLYRAGLQIPPVGMATVSRIEPGTSEVDADVRYFCSLYDEDTGVESDSYAIPDDDPVDPADPTLIQHTDTDTRGAFSFQTHGPTAGVDPAYKWTHLRVYRQNVTLSSPGGRELFNYLSLPRAYSGPTTVVLFDGQTEDDLDSVSSLVTGRFNPLRNGLPAKVGVMASLDGRMFFSDVETPGIVRFSAVGFPDHVHRDDWSDVTGDKDDQITGLEQLGDQLFIGKRKNIWVMSGEVTTETNDTLGTGAAAFASTERTYRTRARAGPVNTGGNGFALTGEPAALYFAADTGFYRFDGLDTRLVSHVIRAKWLEFTAPHAESGSYPGERDPLLNFTYAEDSKNGLLHICCGRRDKNARRALLVYHYRGNRGDGTGYWTTGDIQTGEVAGIPLGRTVTAIATSFAPENERLEYSPMMLATLDNVVFANLFILRQDSEWQDQAAEQFEWRSGDMPLIRGLKQQVGYVKWFLAPGRNGGVEGLLISLEVIPDRDEARKVQLIIPASAAGERVMPVQRAASTVAYRYSLAPGPVPAGFDPQIGLIGWEPFTELTGGF